MVKGLCSGSSWCSLDSLNIQCTLKARLVIKMAVVGNLCFKLSLVIFNLEVTSSQIWLDYGCFGIMMWLTKSSYCGRNICSVSILFRRACVISIIFNTWFLCRNLLSPMAHLGIKLKLDHMISKSTSLGTCKLQCVTNCWQRRRDQASCSSENSHHTALLSGKTYLSTSIH